MARSIARQAAMQLLYERLSGGEADDESLDLVYEQLSMAQPEGSARLRPSKDERQYISDVLTGVEEYQSELDDSIEKHSTGAWTLSRVPHVDLSILRLAAMNCTIAQMCPTTSRSAKPWKWPIATASPRAAATSTASWAQWYATSRSQRHKRPHGGKERANARDPGF